ncbi:hypothetical protein I316_05592 [Kwoniella heveanensis BCC8398]|uniref:Uncharacterized protein n=1 Tax=Kwoniella heveanensis BCC8398 TaxID=1296120 RepID=A0A1B9GNT8_9TREE|nr:hypothetical protein I316_05592 [Kwoniella heveanensis BCC8398]
MYAKSFVALAAFAGAASAQSVSSAASAAVSSASSAVAQATATGTAASSSSTGAANGSAQSVAQSGLSLLSPSCQQTVIQLVSNGSSLSSCLQLPILTQVVTAPGSILEPIENYLDTFCASEACSNETIANATQSVLQGCGSDLTNFGVTNRTVEWAMAQYPLARDLLCLKTTDPFTADNATVSANTTSASSTNSSSNGTFCATSLLTELQSYLGTNLTVTSIITDALGGNATALQTIKSIPPSALCNDCVFAAISLVEEQYPQLGNVSIGNTTLNGFLEGTCNSTSSSNSTSSETYEITTNGTLPDSIVEGASNSSLSSANTTAPLNNVSFPTQLLSTAASAASTYTASLVSQVSGASASRSAVITGATSAAAAATPSNNARALKMRWIGDNAQ